MKGLLFLFAAMAFGQTPAPTPSYLLGPDDQVAIHVLDLDEIGESAFRIDMRGYIGDGNPSILDGEVNRLSHHLENKPLPRFGNRHENV
jgi:hypothetical protein